MSPKLPLLISIPHAGTKIPLELSGRIALSTKDILNDIDIFTDEIYNILSAVNCIQMAEIARPFIDLNRSVNQLPPQFPDGIVKSRTCLNIPVYKTDCFPDQQLIQTLIDRYYKPYHEELIKNLNQPDIFLMLDCHSMAKYPPPTAPDKNKERPVINLGNNNQLSCSFEITHLLAESFIKIFQLSEKEVNINIPFKGGFITSKYGSNPKPVIQIELNRSLYLNTSDPCIMDAKKIKNIRERILDVFQLFFKSLKQHKIL